MSLNDKDLKKLTSKKESKQKVKDICKTEGLHINVKSGVNQLKAMTALKIQAEIEQLESMVKQLKTQLQPIHDELVRQVEKHQTTPFDSVEYLKNGLSLYLYPSQLMKLDEEQLQELAKAKKVFKRIFKPTVKLDEDELVEVLKEGKITTDELRQLNHPTVSSKLRMKHVSSQIDTKTEKADKASNIELPDKDAL